MNNNINPNFLDKVKNDLSQSGQDITNSIDTFNNSLNQINRYMNNINKDQNLKTSSDIEKLKESSSITTSFNKVNIKIKPNVNQRFKASPSSDINCKKLQQKIDSLNYENFVLNKKNKELQNKNEDLIFKMNSDNQKNKTEIMMLNEQLDIIKFNLKQKENEFMKLNEKIKNENNNENELNKVNKINIELKNENEKLKQNQKKLTESIINLENDLKSYKNKSNKINSENEILKREKEITNQKNFFSDKKIEELNEENENLKMEINELKNDNNKLSKKIKDVDFIKQNDYKKEIEYEKEMMNKQLNDEIEKIKFEQKSLMDLKIKKYEEENEDLKYKIQELKDKLNSNKEDNYLIEEIKNKNALLNDESSFLKLQIQLKDSENIRLNKIYKENINLIGELNNENNQLKEKLNLLNNKLKEISTNSITELAEAKNKISLLSSKAQSYDEQDNTFDKIFSEILLDDENTNTNNNEQSKNMISAINQMPQGYNKRIAQFKFMASRLKKLYEEKAILKAKLENIEIENNKYKEQSKMFKNMEENNNESYEYLIKELEKKDSELIYYKEVVNDREIRFKQIMSENEKINAKCNALEKDLKQILENRDKINKLDFLVGKIVENQKKFFGNDNYNQPIKQMNKSDKKEIFKNNKVKFK